MSKDIKRNFIISEKAWNTMQQYARIAYDKDKNEISGITCVKRVPHPVSGKMVWEIFEPVILKQQNTGTTTELDGDALRDYYVKAGMKHGDVRFCWWHSHHTMAAFWSGTDLNEIKAWKNDSWSLALVINLFGDYVLNVSTWEPIEHSEDVPLEIIRTIAEPTKKQLKEYDELCSSPSPVVMPINNKCWTSKFRQTNQVGIWNAPKDDPLADDNVLKWNKNDNAQSYVEVFQFVIDEVEEMMDDYASGKKDYKAYSEFIKAINSRLKEKDAKMNVEKIKQGELLEATSTLFPHDHIKYESEKVQKVYDDALTTIDNTLYGGYGHGWY